MIDELLRLTEEILTSLDFDDEDLIEELIRQRRYLFVELLNSGMQEASTEQHSAWLGQLKHLQSRDQILREKMLKLLGSIRLEMDQAKIHKMHILGEFSRGTQIETSR